MPTSATKRRRQAAPGGGSPSLETRLRIQKLRRQLTGMVLNGNRLQAYRAVEVLEHVATPEARQTLASLAAGAAGDIVTREAHQALVRLKGR